MRRWNGWGDQNTHYPFPDSAAKYLSARIGPGCPTPDATLEQVLQNVPPTGIPDLAGATRQIRLSGC